MAEFMGKKIGKTRANSDESYRLSHTTKWPRDHLKTDWPNADCTCRAKCSDQNGMAATRKPGGNVPRLALMS